MRSIGVSNYGLHHLEHLKSYARVLPSVNQVELNLDQRRELHQATRISGFDDGIFSIGKGSKAQDTHLESMCEGLGFTAPQAAIKWCMDNGAVVIPNPAILGDSLRTSNQWMSISQNN